MRSHRFILVLAALLLPALAPPFAGAAGSETVVAIPGPEPTLTITAAAGDQNDISVDLTKSGYVVKDLGSLVTAGKGCVVVARNTVTCVAAAPHHAEVSLGDLDDSFTGVGNLRTSVDGGTGDDVLAGGPSYDTLSGGTGADAVSGGAASDTVTYEDRVAPVEIRLDGAANDGEAGENDNVRADVEEVTGSRDSDVLTGSDLAHNTLRGSGGDDTLSGLGGDDWLIGYAGADTLLGGDDDDKLSGADNVAGNDSLDGNVGSGACCAPDPSRSGRPSPGFRSPPRCPLAHCRSRPERRRPRPRQGRRSPCPCAGGSWHDRDRCLRT